MNKTYSLDGVQNILAFPFKQPGWQSKFAIGVVLFFANYIIPIVPGVLMTGYFAKMMHASIVDDVELSMPAWDDWGDLFSRGFKVSCASIIYMLPAMVLMVGGYILMYIPLIMDAIASSDRYGSSRDMSPGAILGMFAGMGLFFLGFILYIPLMFLIPPALTHLIAKNSFTAAFRIREWWAIFRANFWGFFTALVVISGVYLVLLMVVYLFYFTVVLCFLLPIGVGVIVMYLSVIGAPMLGEAYRKGMDTLAAASV